MKVKDLLYHPSKVSLREKQLLLAHLLRIKPSDVYLLTDMEVSEELEGEFFKCLSLLEEDYPIQYLIGEWDFYGRTFKVREGVLIPRPETELLVEKTLERIPKEESKVGLEIGVGTGCVAITLLLEREKLFMYGTDLQEEALELAHLNAKHHGVEKRLILKKGDMFEPFEGMLFDFIVSNPPYVPEGVWEKLPKRVRLEGRLSLIGGKKGYEFYERFANEVGRFLKEGGFFALEIGHDQGEVLREILSHAGYKVEVFKDYAGQDRVVVGWK